MCEKSVEDDPSLLAYVSDRFKTEKMYYEAVEEDPWQLKYVPDYFKTQKKCDKIVIDRLYSLQFAPDYFVTQKQLKIWYDDDYCIYGKLGKMIGTMSGTMIIKKARLKKHK